MVNKKDDYTRILWACKGESLWILNTFSTVMGFLASFAISLNYAIPDANVNGSKLKGKFNKFNAKIKKAY